MSESLQTMAQFVVAASTATTQTLAASVDLGERIAELDRLTRHFELSDPGREREK